jgi:intracellular multiplication protein IcmL
VEKKGLERIFVRNYFYWESTRRLELAIFLLFFLLLALNGFYYYLESTEPAPQYFPTTADGRPIRPMPLDLSLHPTNYVVTWAENAILNIYSLDFVNYRQTLQDAQVYFTLKGYLEFKQAYSASNNLEAVRQKRQVVSARITGPTQVLNEGIFEEGTPYSWNLDVPVEVIYQNSENEVITQVGRILMRVQRASLLVHPEGLAIAQLILQAE